MKHPVLHRAFLLLPVLSFACGGDDSSPPPSSPIVINEVMPANKTTCADDLGAYSDWVELYNLGDQAVDLAGYSLSDNPTEPHKATLPAGLSLAPKGVLVLWANDAPSSAPNHLPFKLSKDGETLTLLDPSGKKLDEVSWTAAPSDVSYARAPDGTGSVVTCAKPTCGAANGVACMK